jgi:HK97 family phage major capsid protein
MAYNSLISNSDASTFIPVEETTEIFKEAEHSSIVFQLATKLPNLSRKARSLKVLNALPYVYGVNAPAATQGGLKQTTEMAWEGVTLTAEEIAVIVPIDQATLDDSTVPIWPEVRPAIGSAIAMWVDAAILNGDNAFASWPTSVRATAVAAGNTVALGAGADIYDDILGESGVYSLIEADGYAVSGNIAAVGLKSKMRGLRDSDGNPIFNRTPQAGMGYELDGNPCFFPTHGGFPSANTWMLSGDWKRLVYAFRQDVNYTMHTEGVIQDAGGNIIYNLLQMDMAAMRVTFRFGWALPNPINRLQPTKANRSPFGVLTT